MTNQDNLSPTTTSDFWEVRVDPKRPYLKREVDHGPAESRTKYYNSDGVLMENGFPANMSETEISKREAIKKEAERKPSLQEKVAQEHREMHSTIKNELHLGFFNMKRYGVLKSQLKKYNKRYESDPNFRAAEWQYFLDKDPNHGVPDTMDDIDFIIELADMLLPFKQRYVRAKED